MGKHRVMAAKLPRRVLRYEMTGEWEEGVPYERMIRDLGMSASEFARRMQSAKQSVSLYTQGQHHPRMGTIVGWADALGMELWIELRPKQVLGKETD